MTQETALLLLGTAVIFIVPYLFLLRAFNKLSGQVQVNKLAIDYEHDRVWEVKRELRTLLEHLNLDMYRVSEHTVIKEKK